MSLPKNSEDIIMNPKKTAKNKFLMDNARTVKLIWITKLVIWSNIIPNKTQFLCPAIQFSPIAVLVVFVSPQLQMATKMLSEYHKYLTADPVVATWVWLGSTHFFAYYSYDDQAFFQRMLHECPFHTVVFVLLMHVVILVRNNKVRFGRTKMFICFRFFVVWRPPLIGVMAYQVPAL